ncbi:MAG: hypothetical protein WEG36_09155 [Gemmatimonadota bacterium]
MRHSCPTLRSGARHILPLLALLSIPALPGVGAAQNVNYSVFPTYEELRWDDAFGLEHARMPGVRVGIDFGPFFSLQPFYAWENDVAIRDGLVPTGEAEVSELFDVKLFGAEFQVNFGSGTLVPFVKAGGGVLRTDDEVDGRQDRILLRGGGGVGLSLGNRARVEVYGERLTTRISESFIPGAIDPEDHPEDGLVNSLVLGAGVRLPLGGGFQDGEQGFGILPGIFVEPYVTRIDFDSRLRLARQYTAGGRVGIDLNQNVGLRAYYWRGVDEDFGEWDDVEGYGAEFQFALNTGPGISPFLLVGGGRVQFKDDFTDLDGIARDREDHLTLGGGIAIGLSDHTRIELGARSLLMTVGEEIADVTSPNQLVSNWQYSAGISLAFGARPREPTGATPADPARTAIEREVAALREENERLRRGEDPARVSAVAGDTIPMPRTITVPVPEVGEIILRYGPGYATGADGVVVVDSVALQPAQIEAIVREAVRQELERAGIEPGAAAPAPPAAVPVQPAPPGTYLAGRRLEALVPYTGFQFSPGQLLIGLRADLGMISESLPIEIIPDVSFGFGSGSTTLMAGLNGRFGWDLGTERNVFPFVEAGVALSSRKFLTVNVGYGAEFDLTIAGAPRRIFVMHRGVNAFRENQILVGMRIPR